MYSYISHKHRIKGKYSYTYLAKLAGNRKKLIHYEKNLIIKQSELKYLSNFRNKNQMRFLTFSYKVKEKPIK